MELISYCGELTSTHLLGEQFGNKSGLAKRHIKYWPTADDSAAERVYTGL